MSEGNGDNATVTLPRWFVVILFATLTAAVGAFFKLDSHVGQVDTRLGIIEYRLGLASSRSGVPHDEGVQAAPLPPGVPR